MVSTLIQFGQNPKVKLGHETIMTEVFLASAMASGGRK
jgi:hypothetical protein